MAPRGGGGVTKKGGRASLLQTAKHRANHSYHEVYDQSKKSFGRVISEFQKLDDQVMDCYRKKGLRAWHDHILLNMQKFTYFVFFSIAAIMLVAQGDAAGGNICKMTDIHNIAKFCLYPVYLDMALVVANVLYLTYKALKAHDQLLEWLKEPSNVERILVHLVPLLVVGVLLVTVQSIPECFLTPNNRHNGFCKVFTGTVVKGMLIVIVIFCFVHLFVHIYHHKKLTREIDVKNLRGGDTYGDSEDFEFETEPFINTPDSMYMKSMR